MGILSFPLEIAVDEIEDGEDGYGHEDDTSHECYEKYLEVYENCSRYSGTSFS